MSVQLVIIDLQEVQSKQHVQLATTVTTLYKMSSQTVPYVQLNRFLQKLDHHLVQAAVEVQELTVDLLNVHA